VFYGAAAAAAFAGSANHWTVAEYKAWYFFGGILTAAYLGLGSLYLLGPRRIGDIACIVAIVLSIYAAVRILTYQVDAATAAKLATSTTAQVTDVRSFQVLPPDLSLVAIVMNIPGALLLFGGAAWSAWTFWRRHTPGYRVVSMGFLALGAVVPSVTTGLQRLGYSSGAALGEFLGAVCLLAGLLISLDVFTMFRVPFTSIVLHERTNPRAQAS
jgi:Ca2+/Na+ antiporter